MLDLSDEAVSQAEAAEPDECYKVLQRHFVQEWKILESLIQAMVSSNGDAPMPDIKKAQLIMEKYQEQGQLLEPYLERMVCPLMDILRNQVDDAGNPRIGPVKKVCSIIHTLVTVCGYKTVVKFFPHHASDLELAVALLQVCHEEVEETSILREESTGQWETKCCLLLWLSILVLIPFDIASVDTSLAECDPTLSSGIPPLVERILMICKDYLASPGPMREMAGVLLSRLLTRPDMQVALQSFMQWSEGAIPAALDNSTADFLVPGLIGAVAAIFKVGGSDILIQVTSTAWEEARQLFKSPIASRSLLLRKFLVKLIQRIGLVYLHPRTTWWRYKGTDSLIVQNLSFIPENKLDDISRGEVQQAFLSADIVSSGKVSKLQLNNVDHPKEDEEIDVPDIVEEIIDHLLTSLKDKDTVVRWSAAKGIGRITGRLTSSLADDVVASVLQLLNPLEGDGAWHGGCLALAELARRGLLIPNRLKDVVPLIIQALHYDVRRGSHSVGAHVRDAAAYVCWAFARAYSPVIMKKHLEKLAPVLLTVTCYDREVNCRRAASAAFQENVGRQGDYLHGIDLVNAADYFSLASRSTSYCSVAVYVAQFSEYRLSLVQELVETKIRHWDKGLRELAAEALALLVKYEPIYFGEHVLDSLLPSVLSPDLNLRHGATLAIAETILSLKNNSFIFSTDKEKALANIVPSIEKARLYRGKGGEIMRAAVSRLIECEALVQIPLPTKVLKANLETINENLKHPNGQIQACAIAALRAFLQSYMLPSNESTIQQITMKHLHILRQDVNSAAKRGSALALGSLPACFLVPVWKDIIGTLCNACMVEENPEERDAETRVNAVRGLVAVCKNLFEAKDKLLQSTASNKDSLVSVMKEKVMDSLFKALDDYSVDNRGDVGSWVREAAIMGLEQIVGLLCRSLKVLPDSSKQLPTNQMDVRDSEDIQELVLGDNKNDIAFNRDLAIRLIGGLVKQGLEKINRVRDTAGQSLRRILHNKAVTVPFVPHKEELQLLVPEDTSINWGAPDDAFPRLVPLLKFTEYTMYVMSGLVISVGGLADSLGKISLKCLLEVLQEDDHLTAMKESAIEDSVHASNWLGGALVSVLKTYAGVERVITPAFKTIDILFSKGAFQSIQTLQASHAAEILASIKLELKGSKDIVKTMAGISVLGHLALLPGSVGLQAISQLLMFLGHRYPKVRKACSEQVYLLLVQRGEELLQPDDLEAAQELVSESCWDGPLENLSKERQVLASMFKLQNEVKELTESDDPGKLVSRRWAVRDENASYAALVSENR